MAGVQRCHPLRDAALACLLLLCCAVAQGQAQEEGSVRLTGGTHALQGYLQVFFKGQWGTVCRDRHWSEEDAQVVCRQIGALEGVMFAESQHDFEAVDGSLPILMSKVKCDGSETRLTDCPFLNVTSCTHVKDVKLDCVIPGYKACVVYDADAKRPLTGKVHDPAEKSITECTRLCRQDGYHYAGLATDTCLCGSAGDDYESFGVMPNSECDAKCLGEASQNCGAQERLAVHDVRVGSCSGSLKAKEGSIVSPGFPGKYPQDQRDCQWVVDVTENGDTAVEFPIFNLVDNDSLLISTDGGKNWTAFRGMDYQDSPPQVPTFDAKKLIIKFSILEKAVEPAAHVSFIMTFRDNTTCEVIEFDNGVLDVETSMAYTPGDTAKVLCDRKYRSQWEVAMCKEDGLWYFPPVCEEAPPPGYSLVFTQTYLFMMLAVMGALGFIFFLVICGVICVGRKKKKEGYTGISRQESAEPNKAEHEYHVDMREGSDMDMQNVGAPEDQGIPLASGAMDE